MKNKAVLIFILLAAAFGSCSRYDLESDFSVSRNSSLTSVTITGYEGINQKINIPPVIIELAVTSIGEGAFSEKKFTNVKIPDSVISIGEYAFAGNQLKSVNFGSRVTVFGDGAFYENQLTNISIPKSVTTIGSLSFYGNQLTSVTIANGVISIADYAFAGNKLKRITIPKSVTELSGFNDNLLTSITIPNSVTIIGFNAFNGNKLTKVTIPDSVTYIDSQAFYGNQLKSVAIPDSVTAIGSGAFGGNPSLTEINVSPNNENYSSLDGVLYTKDFTTLVQWPAGKHGAVTIPESVTTIGNGAFSGNQLTDVIIPNGITTIGQTAFAGNQLVSIVIPDSVITIGLLAFSNNQLTSFTFPYGLRVIEAEALKNNLLTSITIPNSITTINSNAFYDNQLTNITIPNSVTEIGQGAFFNNPLTSITIGANVSMFQGSSTAPASFSDGFVDTYYNGGRRSGTYTRSSTNSAVWIRSGTLITLNASNSFTSGNIRSGDIHYYRVYLENSSYYEIVWRDADSSAGLSSPIDAIVGVRREDSANYIIPVSDSGNYGTNTHRIYGSGSASSPGYEANNWYIIEVRGYSGSSSGNYQIILR